MDKGECTFIFVPSCMRTSFKCLNSSFYGYHFDELKFNYGKHIETSIRATCVSRLKQTMIISTTFYNKVVCFLFFYKSTMCYHGIHQFDNENSMGTEVNEFNVMLIMWCMFICFFSVEREIIFRVQKSVKCQRRQI